MSPSQLQMYDLAVKTCDVVLATQRDNVKATFRKGQCLVALGDTETAKNVLRAAQALDPENKVRIHETMGRVL